MPEHEPTATGKQALISICRFDVIVGRKQNLARADLLKHICLTLSCTPVLYLCAMSDSEDDFMSDKFLVESPPKASTATYSQRRSIQQLKGLRSVQANNKLSIKQLEEQRRREGLNTSLFDRVTDREEGDSAKNGESSGAAVGGGPKAMEMMMKMGWKVGQGLGRKRSASPEDTVKRAKNNADTETSRAGIGRTEPIRVSLWAGRKGLSARSPSPPPLPTHRNPDALDPRKMARLTTETEDFRERQRRLFGEKEIERKEARAREMLMQYDHAKGVKVSHKTWI